MSENTPFRDHRELAAVLGGFWTRLYEGRDEVVSLVQAVAMLERQTSSDVQEVLDALSRETVPTAHYEHWYLLRVRESELQTGGGVVARHDTGYVYDGTLNYGTADLPRRRTVPGWQYALGESTESALGYYWLAPARRYATTLPTGLLSPGILQNRLTDPSVLWVAGTDYYIDQNYLVFVTDPFAAGFATQDIMTDGVMTDREAWIWLRGSRWDRQTVHEQYGYALRIPHSPLPSYRELVNAVHDGLLDGGSEQSVLRGICAAVGAPLVSRAGTVEQIVTDHRALHIVTDQEVLSFGKTATPLVAVGNTVVPGQAVTDAVQTVDWHTGTVSPEVLPSFVFGGAFVSNCYPGGLAFENREVEITVTSELGYTRVDFPIGGHPADVADFFSEMHRRGVAEANRALDDCEAVPYLLTADRASRYRSATLAHWLDTRYAAGAERVGEPTAAHLPTTINPLNFLISNFLRYSTVLVKIRPDAVLPGGLGLPWVRYVDGIVPAHACLLLLAELTVPGEVVSATNAVTESLETYVGAEPFSETITPSLVQESLRAWYVLA